MASYLSNLVNLGKGIHTPRCWYGYYNKKRETCGIKYKDCECCLEYKNVKVDLIEYKCLCCNKYYQKNLIENLKKIFANTHRFSNHDANKFSMTHRHHRN